MSASDVPVLFLTDFYDIWKHLMLWTTGMTSFAFFLAGVRMTQLNKTWHQWIWLPILHIIIGAFTGILEGALSAFLIASIYVAIPYAIGIDVAAGLGIGQALVIIYFHLGRAEFMYR